MLGEAELGSKSAETEKPEISMMTQNTWFEPHNRMERYHVLV
jgi:hypothetical protein